MLPQAPFANAKSLFLAALFIAGGIGLSGSFIACNRPAKPLRIGIDDWPVYRLMKLAEDKGFFRDEGVDVTLLEFNSYADSRRAYDSRRIDGMGSTAVEVLITRDQSGRNTRIVRVLNFSEGADVIVAGKSVRSMSDLRGKRIGVELGTFGVYVLARALELEGLSLEDVTPVSTSQAAMVAHLSDGVIDAAVTYTPVSTSLLADPRFHAVFSTAQIPGEVVDVIAIGGFILRERPQQAAGFLRGVDRAFAYLNENPEDACRIMAEGLNMPPEEFRKALTTGLHLVGPDEQAAYLAEGGKLQPVLESLARTLRKIGMLSDRPGLTDCLPSQ